MTGLRIAVPCGVAVMSALAAFAIAPRAFDAAFLLAVQDDPVALADHAIAHSFDTTVASREINAALAAEDTDLAQSFVDLAREQNLPLDPALKAKVDAPGMIGGGAAPKGVADMSLYRRLAALGLNRLKCFPQLVSVVPGSERIERYQQQILAALHPPRPRHGIKRSPQPAPMIRFL